MPISPRQLADFLERRKAHALVSHPHPAPHGRAIVVESAWVLGTGADPSPLVLIQDGERTFHRADGVELRALADRYPGFARWAVSPREDE